MPEDIYLRFVGSDGNGLLQGECMDFKHPGSDGWIQFKSISFACGFGKEGSETKQEPAKGKDPKAAAKKPAEADKKKKSNMHSGSLDFERVRMSKNSDLTSSRLMEMCHSGEVIPKVVVEACRSGGVGNAEKLPFLRLTFEGVCLKTCKLNLAVEGLPGEDLEFEYDLVKIKSMWTDNQTGAERTSQPQGAGWDLKNQKYAPGD